MTKNLPVPRGAASALTFIAAIGLGLGLFIVLIAWLNAVTAVSADVAAAAIGGLYVGGAITGLGFQALLFALAANAIVNAIEWAKPKKKARRAA